MNLYVTSGNTPKEYDKLSMWVLKVIIRERQKGSMKILLLSWSLTEKNVN